MNIAICGLGVVGTCHKNWFLRHGHTVLCYDPPKGLMGNLDDADLVFICVPTPDGPRHLLHIDDCVGRIPGAKTIVIRSTVTPGTTSNLQRQYPQHRFLYIPEFLQEDTAQADFNRPPLVIIGARNDDLTLAKKVYELIPGFSPVYTSTNTAELYKLARNAFLATKNAFFNQLYDYSKDVASYYDLALAAAIDPLIGTTHTITPHKGKRGYAGKCLPKDANILLSSDIHHKLSILLLANAYNQELLREQGLLT